MSKIQRILKVISQYGELISIEAYSDETYNDYGDVIVATTSPYTNIKAIFNTAIVNENGEIEGRFQAGEGVFYFKGDQLGIENDNVIVRSDGTRYKITRTDSHFYKGTKVVQEARVGND